MSRQKVFGVGVLGAVVFLVVWWSTYKTSDGVPQTGKWWAIEGATLYTMDKPRPERGTVLLRGDTIVQVGLDVKLPKGTTLIKAYGKVLTPGLVIANTRLGLVEITLEPLTRDDTVVSKKPVRAALRAFDALNHDSSVIPVTRVEGITSVMTRPMGGLIAGQSALIDLWGLPEQMAVRQSLALHATIPPAQTAYAWLKLRQALEAARVFLTYRSQYIRRKILRLPFSRFDLIALGQVVKGELPLVLDVERAADILTAIRFASEQNIKLILSGASEGWQVAQQLARAKIPVLLNPPSNLPANFTMLGSRYDNAALLHKAGVTIAFGSRGGAHHIRSLRHEAGVAVAWGLPHVAALQALSCNLYKIFGLGNQYGILRRGYKANLVLWNGDPVELSTRAVQVWIRGQAIPMVSRQTMLRERYRDLKSLYRKP